MTIQHLISAGRKRLGMTEQRFADAAGVSRSAVQQWESGATAPRRSHQQRVADLLGITVGELMAGVSARYPEKKDPKTPTGDAAGAQHITMPDQVQQLMGQLSPEGQREAVVYLRYLVHRYPLVQSEKQRRDHPIPGEPKAA